MHKLPLPISIDRNSVCIHFVRNGSIGSGCKGVAFEGPQSSSVLSSRACVSRLLYCAHIYHYMTYECTAAAEVSLGGREPLCPIGTVYNQLKFFDKAEAWFLQAVNLKGGTPE
eukprot:6463057-Amphidinium_carterae.2